MAKGAIFYLIGAVNMFKYRLILGKTTYEYMDTGINKLQQRSGLLKLIQIGAVLIWVFGMFALAKTVLRPNASLIVSLVVAFLFNNVLTIVIARKDKKKYSADAAKAKEELKLEREKEQAESKKRWGE